MNREIEREVTPLGIQARALERYEGMLDMIATESLRNGITPDDLFSDMFEKYGTTEKTVARYLKVALKKSRIEYSGKIIRRKL